VKIAVLVKEVPDAAVQKRIDPSTGRLDRSGERNLNPYDTHAIEAAMQIKEGGAERVLVEGALVVQGVDQDVAHRCGSSRSLG
jgi:electron transfer flavoprotein alpha/beta subunit